jgi:hypothetical protein
VAPVEAVEKPEASKDETDEAKDESAFLDEPRRQES